MTDAEVLRESWRLHFYRLAQTGTTLKDGQEMVEYLGDDEEFERYMQEVENEAEDLRIQQEVQNSDWEPLT